MGTLRTLVTQARAPRTRTGVERHRMDTELAVGFGYKCGWIAVPVVDGAQVLAALPVEGALAPTTFARGLELALSSRDRAGPYFVTPPIDGWTLIVAASMPEPVVGEPSRSWLEALSARLGVDCYWFANHRVSDYYGWAYAERGKVTRVHVRCQGDVRSNEGPASATERSYGYRAQGYWSVNEELVLTLASEWSVDPRELDGRDLGRGWLVQLG